ncbi:TPA: hypothetical protein J8Z92_002684 [Escherichia coli]|nr:hypothetical protein [Escherichia coli]
MASAAPQWLRFALTRRRSAVSTPLNGAVLTPACTHLFGSFISRRLLLRFSFALLYAMLGTHRLPARRTGYRSGVM